MSTVIARSITTAVTPIILLVAIALTLQGHNLPGGGFIGGVLTAAAVSLVYIVYSLDYVQDLFGHTTSVSSNGFVHGLIEEYRDITAVGLALAAGTGLAATVFGVPFLSHTFWIFEHVPVFGHVEIATAMAFDLGVYIVVVSGLLTIVTVVGEQ